MTTSNAPRPHRRHRSLLSLALLSPFVGIALGWGSPADLPEVAAAIEQRFPAVREIEPDQLEHELAGTDAGTQRPILLDVRSADEYAVSHIEGAVRAETLDEARTVLEGAAPETPIVVYCAVGWRSAELAEELEAAGYDRVRNLRGAIFGWANSGRPLVRNGRPVEKVHPYSRTWGKLLRDNLRAEMPTDELSTRPAS